MNSEPPVLATLPLQSLTDAQVRQLLFELTGIDPANNPDVWEACEDAILAAVNAERGLHMRPGGWTVDLTDSTARFVVAAALIAACLWYVGLDQLPAILLPQVLPILFDIKKARLSRSDQRLLLHLRLAMTAEQMQYPWPPEALYGRLPDHLRSVVSQEDFEDFIRRLVHVGEADDAGHDEVRIRPAGKAAWLRITIR
jgi:hypothetical protein